MLGRLPLEPGGTHVGERERDGRLQLFEKIRKYLKEREIWVLWLFRKRNKPMER